MLTAERRGHIAGAQEARKYPHGLSEEKIKFMAHSVFVIMRANGFAPLEPEKDFVDGFVNGFHLVVQLS